MLEIFSLFIKCLFALFLILPFFYVLFIEEKLKQLKAEQEPDPDPVLITEAEQEPQKEEEEVVLPDKISFACWSVESKQTNIIDFRE